MANPAPARRRRRWWKALLGLSLLLVASVVALPWGLNTSAARRWLLGRANRVLAPGALEVSSFRFSWLGPTVMTDFAIRDAQGDRVVLARRAVWDRDLAHILFDRPRYGTLWLDGAALDVERRPDGTVDLYEALRPILGPNPRVDLTIRIRGGSLRFRSPGLAQPALADRVDLTIQRPPRPLPLRWEAALAQGRGDGTPTLKIAGHYNGWSPATDAEPDLALAVEGRRWPIDLEIAGQSARGRFDGPIRFARLRAGWSTDGSTRWDGLDISGRALAGDHLRLDRLKADWKAAATAGGWSIDRVDLESSLATLRSSAASPGGPTRVRGRLDLAALAKQLPHALRLRDGLTVDRGSADLRIVSATEEGRRAWDVEARVSDLAVRDRDRSLALRDPATLSARLVRGRSELAVRHATLETAFLSLRGEGDVDRGIKLSGQLDLAALARQAGDLIDLGGLELEGHGPLTAEYRREGPSGFAGSLVLDLDHPRLTLPEGPTIRREVVHLHSTLRGSCDSSGLPRGWDGATIEIDSADLAASLSAKAKGGRLDELAADLKVSSASSEDPLGLDGHLLARSDGPIWAIDDAGLRLIRRKAPDEASLALTVRGRFDPEAGELVLGSAARDGEEPSALALAGEGFVVRGLKRGGGGLRAEGGFEGDVGALGEALTPLLKTKLGGLAGSYSARLEARGGDGLQFGGKVEVRDLPHADGPVTLDLRGVYRPEADRVELAELVLAGHYARLEASGSLADLAGSRRADVKGKLSPDWEAISAALRERIEPEARVSGQTGEFHVLGPLVGDRPGGWPEGLDASLGLDLTGVDVYGMRVGPATVAASVKDGRLVVGPIETTLNGGTLRLGPEIARDEGGALLLRLAPGSSVEDAAINDEVSRRVLAYAAPILGDASEVRGRVSARIDRAEFPIAADIGRKAIVEGQVVFQDVVFTPGPLGRGLLELINRGDPTLALDQPVILSIAEGKVHERGLVIPVGRLTRIAMEGTIGFDRSLDMVASIPLRPSMLPEGGLLADVLEGTRVRVPITGTLSDPQVDREAFRLGMKDMGKDLLEKGAAVGAARILERLMQPRDPNAPPRLTPEERKARRQERRMQRRLNRQP